MSEYTTLSQSVKFCETSYVSRTAELNTLTTKKDKYTDELKATRKQRVELLKNIKKDFVSLIKSLMDEKIRENEGRELNMMQLASKKEYERLTELHKYSDGILDIPILNSDSVEGVEGVEDASSI